MRLLAALLLAALLAGCAAQPPPGPATTTAPTTPPTSTPAPTPPAARAPLALELLVEGLDAPLLVTWSPHDEGALWLLEQEGRVLRLAPGASRPEVALDVRDKVRAGGEQGLLGLAFHPGVADNGMAFLSYTDREGDSVLARYRVDGATLDPASEEILLRVDQPYPNHNGGHLAFGPDGFLYYGLGDGGGAGDPDDNGQDPRALLGSLLRLDVDEAPGYAIPPGNPYADGEEGAPEVWAKGLRNPWRFSFDRETGDLLLGDVGQNRVEEVDFVPAGAEGGINFGWPVYEGTRRHRLLGEPFSEAMPPVLEYTHGEGECSVTGGHVYRGEAMPSWRGEYLFADYCSGRVWAATPGEWEPRLVLETGFRVSSFGEDEAGALYVVDHGGAVHRLREAP